MHTDVGDIQRVPIHGKHCRGKLSDMHLFNLVLWFIGRTEIGSDQHNPQRQHLCKERLNRVQCSRQISKGIVASTEMAQPYQVIGIIRARAALEPLDPTLSHWNTGTVLSRILGIGPTGIVSRNSRSR